jgi:hypothetical protein
VTPPVCVCLVMTTISLKELLNAPMLPNNLPKFEIIKECEKVQEEFSNDESSDSENSLSESEIEEVFPCDCGFDEYSSNFDGQACGPTAHCINRELFIECNEEECPCRERCQNRRFQKRQYAKVKVVETPGKGFGLFTCEDLKPGNLVMEYVGEIVTQDQMNERARKYSAQGQSHFYFMTLRPNQIIDATCKGNLSRFLNHSCSPNCETQKWIVGGRIKIGLFTLKTIKAGSELTFDYKFVRFGKEPQKCLCGEANCTGFIGVSQKTENEKNGRKKRTELVEDVDEFEVFMESDPKSAEFPSEISLIVTKLIQTDDVQIIKKLLVILESTEKYLCKRKFLNLHGLKLLATLFTENSKDNEIISSILNILKGLPLSTRNLIEDAGWFEKLKLVKPEFEEIVRELEEKWGNLELAFKIPKKSETIEKNGYGSGQATPNPSASVLMSVPFEFSSALKRKRQWSLEDEFHPESNLTRDNNQRDNLLENSRDRESKSVSRSRSPVKKIPDPIWLSAKAPDGKIYYYHSVTRETSWELPMIEVKERERRHDKEQTQTYDKAQTYDKGYRDRELGRDKERDDRFSEKYSNERYNDKQGDKYNNDKYRSSQSHTDYSRDNRDNHNRDSHKDSYRDTNRDNNRDFKTFNPSNSNSAFLEGVGDSNQLTAIIERAKARRTQVEDGEVDSIVIDLNTQSINSNVGHSSPFFMASPVDSKSSNNSIDKKYYAKLKEEISGVVIRFFSHYRQELGEEFKELARKYTHKIIEKESKEVGESFSPAAVLLTSKKKQKIKAYLAEVLKGRKIKLLPEHEY